MWVHNVNEPKKSAETRKKNENRCRNGMPKSTQTSKDKSDDKYTKPNS